MAKEKVFTPRALWDRRSSIATAIIIIGGACLSMGAASQDMIATRAMVYEDHRRIDANELRAVRIEQKVDDMMDALGVKRRQHYAGDGVFP